MAAARMPPWTKIRAPLRTLLRTGARLALAGAAGVLGASLLGCAFGLLRLDAGSCYAIPLYLVFGSPLAAATALVLGGPACLLFRWMGWARWWQFAAGGLLLALPLWWELAQPLDSPRWQFAGLRDSVVYLGTGLFAGLYFWWLVTPGPRFIGRRAAGAAQGRPNREGG